jgi:NADH pyrophosphatase NudC (nudix superfamily)
MDEEIELKDNKINVSEKELKDVNHFDEQKIQTLLNKNLVIRKNNKERAKRRLLDTLSLSYK